MSCLVVLWIAYGLLPTCPSIRSEVSSVAMLKGVGTFKSVGLEEVDYLECWTQQGRKEFICHHKLVL